MTYNRKSLQGGGIQGIVSGTTIGGIKGDAGSLAQRMAIQCRIPSPVGA